MKNCWIVLVTAVLLTPCFAEMKRAVRTESGLVSGVAARDASVTVFKGIPYAEPPLGNLRWTAPRPPLRWDDLRNADHFSDACAQIFAKADFPKSEDCLYLNVWTPAKSSGAGLPVMVWRPNGWLSA